MIVLALTILGISLFSLSGYEAQFMGASLHKTQSFYDAVSGLERTKYILAAGHTMQDVKSNYPDGVIYASAVRGDPVVDAVCDSTGLVSFSDPSPVRLRVVAERMGERTMLEGKYVPVSDRSLYRDLIATTGRISVYRDSENYEYDNIVGCGTIRNPDYSDWFGKIIGDVTHVVGGVPTPNVADFISEWELHPSIGTPSITGGGGTRSYHFNLQSQPFRIFSGPQDPKPGDPSFGLWDASTDSITFDVEGNNGTAVWLLRDGACFDRWVTVTGAPSNNLIIVAEKGTNLERGVPGAELGLWFRSGISSAGPNLFLVSDGTVALDRLDGTSHENMIPFLAVFSGGVYLRGPKGGSDTGLDYIREFHLKHCAGNDDAILDPLYDAGLLPNTRGRDRTFALVPGTFQEITASTPTN